MFILFGSQSPVFRIAKTQLDVTFPQKQHFCWCHNYVSTT